LDDCDDAFVLRAAELFFRTQKLALHTGSLLSTDSEAASTLPQQPPLISLLRLEAEPGIEVLSTDNAGTYWERSDAFDLALDLTAGRRGLAALGEVIQRWVRHLLGVEVEVQPFTELHDIALTWYVGLDANATRIGDDLWTGRPRDANAPEFILGLYRLQLLDNSRVLERVQGEPVYLIAAGAGDMTLRLKPQNLLTGLPLRC